MISAAPPAPPPKSRADLRHDFPFDPTHGYDLDRLLRVPAPAEPGDFAAFWQATYAEARVVELEVTRREVSSPHPACALFEVEFNSFGGVRIGGWLTVPHAKTDITGGWVVGHGYGGREAPNFDLPDPAAPAIFPCARGFSRSRHPQIPDKTSAHVLHGIRHRDTYVHRGCAADLWCAASALTALFPGAQRNLRYYGASFGGGIGALALPWDERFRGAFLGVPSFGNHPLRVQLPCVGSGEAVRQYLPGHPGTLDVLAYYDAASAARHIKIPTVVAAAKFDPAVPPPGQFSIYNALAAEKDLFVRTAAHFASRHEAGETRTLKALLACKFGQLA